MAHAPAPADPHAVRPIAVFAHVHYPDIWREMAPLLSERLTRPFRLVVTTSHAERDIAVPKTAALVSADIRQIENRGRDILPFLRALASAGDFEFGLKLHAKKSPQRMDGDRWRDDVLASLLPPDDGKVNSGAIGIVNRMAADPRIGFVTPAHFCLSVKPWVLVNRPGMDAVMAALDGASGGVSLRDADMDDCFFAAGSMFWFRRTALARLADEAVTSLFEPEEGQLDGTVAHAMERLFPVEARRQGLISLALPALAASRPDMPTAELLKLARLHADVPSTYFPAPYVAALPPVPLATAIVGPSPVAPRGLLKSLFGKLPAPVRVRLRRLVLG